MIKNIWKFELDFSVIQRTVTVQVPSHANFLSVGLQGNDPHQVVVAWFRFSPTYVENLEPRAFTLCATGEEVDSTFNAMEYCGTVQFDSGFVGHIFENKL